MKRILVAIALALAALLAATGVGLGVIQATGFPYSVDIDYLNIPEAAAMPREEVLANYNAVIDYCTPFTHKEFKLPTLSNSLTGAEHFADVRTAFTVVYIAALFGIIVIVALFVLRAVSRRALKYAGILTLAIPLVFAGCLAIDFEGAFVLFHKLFFAGDTWIFDPSIDEIISILPEEFFMHCALFIALFWLLAAVGFFIAAKRKATCQEK